MLPRSSSNGDMGAFLPLSKAAPSDFSCMEIILLAFTVLVVVGLVGETRKHAFTSLAVTSRTPEYMK
jgi:hypothetical protein